MTWNYSVSFESETNPVKTFKGSVDGAFPTASRRAAMDAKKQAGKGLRFRSMVVVLEKPARNDGGLDSGEAA